MILKLDKMQILDNFELLEEKKGEEDRPLISSNSLAPLIMQLPNKGGGTTYLVIINTMIAEANTIIELIEILTKANEKDNVEIILNSPGGVVPSLMEFLSAMEVSKARVNTKAFGVVASAAAVIWAAGTEPQMSDSSVVMFHSSSHLDFGKSLDIVDNANAIIDMMKNLMQPSVDKGILTEKQFIEMFDEKKDVYIFADDFNEKKTNNQKRGTDNVSTK